MSYSRTTEYEEIVYEVCDESGNCIQDFKDPIDADAYVFESGRTRGTIRKVELQYETDGCGRYEPEGSELTGRVELEVQDIADLAEEIADASQN